MKVLGISFGRKLQNTELLVRQALAGAAEAGAEISLFRTMDKKISHCTGCFACVVGMWRGGNIRCVQKDDYMELANAIDEADAIILGAPVYAVGPTGQLKNVIDRYGPAHDRWGMVSEQEKRLAAGLTGDQLLPDKLLKQKPIGFISVGGCHTQHWVALGLPVMKLFGMSTNMIPVDEIDAYNMGERGNPVLDDELMAHAARMGKAVAEAVGKAPEEIAWQGDRPGLCPVCHSSLIQPCGGMDVECVVCGIRGTISADSGEIHVHFPAAEQDRSRYRIGGLKEHALENDHYGKIGMQKREAAGEELARRLEALKALPL